MLVRFIGMYLWKVYWLQSSKLVSGYGSDLDLTKREGANKVLGQPTFMPKLEHRLDLQSGYLADHNGET